MSVASEIFLGSIACGVLAIAFQRYNWTSFLVAVFLAGSVGFCILGMRAVAIQTPPIDNPPEPGA